MLTTALFLGSALSPALAGEVVDFETKTARKHTSGEHFARIEVVQMYRQLDRIAERMVRLESIAIDVREAHLRRVLFDELRSLNAEVLTLERQIEAAATRPQRPPRPPEPVPPAEPVWDRGACETTLSGHFSESFHDARAYDEAREACETPFDMDVYAYLYPRYEKSFASYRAAEEAVERARQPGVGDRLAIIDWAYTRLEKSFAAYRAAEDAVEETEGLTEENLECLERAYTAYEKSLSSYRAVEKAIEACR